MNRTTTANGLIESITCTHGQELHIDCGDSFIYINKRGTFNGQDQYSWTQTAPTSGLEMDYESFIITKEGILTNINAITDYQITKEQHEAVKLFFGD